MNIAPLFKKGNERPNSARQLKVRHCPLDLAIEFNELHHSRLPRVIASNIYRNTYWVSYSAVFDDYVYATAIWSSPIALNRMKRKDVLELRRMAICDLAPKFTATYMLGKMVKDIKKRIPEIGLLISYQDTDVHSGTIYKAGNWKMGVKSDFSDINGWASRKSIDKSGVGGKKKVMGRNKPQTSSQKIRWEYEIRSI